MLMTENIVFISRYRGVQLHEGFQTTPQNFTFNVKSTEESENIVIKTVGKLKRNSGIGKTYKRYVRNFFTRV